MKKLNKKQRDWLVMVHRSGFLDGDITSHGLSWNPSTIKKWIENVLKNNGYEERDGTEITDLLWIEDLRKSWIKELIKNKKCNITITSITNK